MLPTTSFAIVVEHVAEFDISLAFEGTPETQNCAHSSYTGTYCGAIELPYFDAELGTLTSATFGFRDVSTSYTANVAFSTPQSTRNAYVDPQIAYVANLASPFPALSEPDPVEAYYSEFVSTQLSGNGGTLFHDTDIEADYSEVFSSPDQRADLTDDGLFIMELLIDARDGGLFINGVNPEQYTISSLATFRGQAFITYEYEARNTMTVPEPDLLPIILLVILGLVAKALPKEPFKKSTKSKLNSGQT